MIPSLWFCDSSHDDYLCVRWARRERQSWCWRNYVSCLLFPQPQWSASSANPRLRRRAETSSRWVKRQVYHHTLYFCMQHWQLSEWYFVDFYLLYFSLYRLYLVKKAAVLLEITNTVIMISDVNYSKLPADLHAWWFWYARYILFGLLGEYYPNLIEFVLKYCSLHTNFP